MCIMYVCFSFFSLIHIILRPSTIHFYFFPILTFISISKILVLYVIPLILTFLYFVSFFLLFLHYSVTPQILVAIIFIILLLFYKEAWANVRDYRPDLVMSGRLCGVSDTDFELCIKIIVVF
jgi:hypothetical protein